MENQELKNSMKRIKNRIILKNLTEKQKGVLIKTGIIGSGLGSGLFMLYSMKEPETIPGVYPDSTPEKDLTEPSDGENINSVEIVSLKPVTEISEQNISFGEAFKVARELCGPGGWFIWKGNIYNTYYKEEWQALSQDERNDYLASIEIENTQNHDGQHLKDTLNDDSVEEIIATNDESMEEIESENNVQENEILIDLKSYNDLKTNTQQNFSADKNDLITGEIITFDDDSDITENGFFELPDDIEITAISDEESYLIDKLSFDSSEVTAFPWETTEVVAENEIAENEIDTISVNELDDLKEPITDKTPGANEEYPWGEKISNTMENKAEPQVLEEIQQDDTSNIISNPEEITEYPWGEKIEVNEMTSNAQIIIHENEVIDLKEENIGVILPEETETASLSKLPPSFDEITEFPWGETVLHSPVDPYISPENDFFENPTIQHRTLLDDNE